MATKKSTTNSGNKAKKQVKKEEKIEEVKEEKPIEVKEEVKQPIEDIIIDTKKTPSYKHPFVHFMVVVVMIISLISFGITLVNKDSSILAILTHLLLTIFTVIFGVVSITYKRKRKSMILISSILLIVYFLLQLNLQVNVVSSPITLTPNFSGKSITEVMKWADKNKVSIEQEYEYSDMIPEYSVISQSVEAGSSLKDIDTIVVSISEGPNPYKEIMVPNMISWDSEKVLKFIKDNYMSNVSVEFEASDKAKDTVISQSASGSLKRNDEMKLVFSYGEELGFSEVTLEDLTGKSEFEVTFYMKQNQLNYTFDYAFDKKIKKGLAIRQSVPAGEKVGVHDKIISVTISKGPEIKIPDFTKYSMTKVAEWAIQNKVKISFENEYDENVKENNIIGSNYKEGDIIEQGTTVKIIISRGSLKMPKFKSFDEFYEWAVKYNIFYEEVHEFHDSVPAGEVISYSYKSGEAIKKDTPVVVKISDGVKKSVPSVIGLTRKEAINKLKAVGLNYSVIYRNSSEAKEIVLSQSIRAGSEVSQGTTVTITVSNGKQESSGGNNNSGGGSTPTPTPDPTPTPEPEPPTPQCNSCNFRPAQITSTLQQYNSYDAAANGLRSYLQGQCPGLTVSISGVNVDGYDPGDYVSGFSGGPVSSCDTISITLAK